MKKIDYLQSDLLPLAKLLLPLVLIGVTQSSAFFFETIFLAHLGQETLAAGALACWLYATLVVISFGTLSSVNVLIAHKHGEGDKDGIAHILRDGLLLSLLLAGPAFILLWEMSPIFLLFGQHPALVRLAEAYLHALAWSVLPNMITITFFEFLIGIAHTRVIVLFTLSSVFLTVLCSYLFIFGRGGFPPMGIAGAGWGITVSTCITAFCVVTYVLSMKKYRAYCYALFDFKGTGYLFDLIKLGIPIGLMYCFEVSFFLALTLMMGTLGQTWMAANQVAMQYMGSLMGVVFSIAQAITVRMGHLLGEGATQLAKRSAYLGISISVFLMLAVALAYFCIPERLIAIDFVIDSAANKDLVIHLKQLFLVAACFQLVEAIRISLFGALRALKDTRFPLFVSILSFWGIAIPVGYLFACSLNFHGVGLWWGMVLGASISVSLLQWRFIIQIKARASF